jgi:hypothetical protein
MFALLWVVSAVIVFPDRQALALSFTLNFWLSIIAENTEKSQK